MIDVAGVRRGDQNRALWLSTIAFTVCFAVWTIFSIIGVQIKKDLGLSDTQFGLLVGTPILTGSLIRLMLGIWTDQYGGRIVYTAVMLSAAVATWLLTFAYDYPTFLLAALGVGIAGGSFAVGIAYVSKWFPKESQGTALGIFGAGNVGAAVTKFVAPFIMVAYGWKTVANVWAIAIAVMAVVFWLMTKDDPQLEARRRSGAKPESLRAMLEPLKNIQVWRFSLYYFFVFGAFVALALWLPRYLIGVYGLDITTAGMIGAAYSVPASLFRVYGGVLSDKYGARRIMYWTFGMSVVCCFVLSYPPTEYVVQGIRGPMSFRLETGLVAFTVIAFVLGFFMSLGKAAVYKHIPVYYPQPRGLGRRRRRPGRRARRLRPSDPVRCAQRSDRRVAELLHGCCSLSPRWRWFGCTSSIRAMEKGVYGAELKKLPELPEMQEIHEPKHVGALGPHLIEDWRPEDKEFWQSAGRKLARRNLLISIPCAAALVRRLDGVVGGRGEAAVRSASPTRPTSCSGSRRCRGFRARRCASSTRFMVPIFGGRLWTTLTTWSLIDPGDRHRHGRAEPGDALLAVPGAGAAVRLRRRQLRLLDGEHLLLLPEGGEGQRAGAQCRPRQSRRQRRAVRRAARHHGRRIRLARRRADHGQGGRPDVPMWLQNAGFIWVPFIVASAFAAWFGMNDIASAKASFAEQAVIFRAQAQLDHVLALHRHLRLVHRLFGGLPAARQDAVPRGQRARTTPSSVRWSARSRARSTGWVSDKCGGGRVTFWVFVGMAVGVVGVLYFLGVGSWPGFFAMFLFLFFVSGVGNASTFQMIPAIMRTEMDRLMPTADAATRVAAGRQGKRGDHRLHLGDRGLRRLLHPQELRHLDQHDRRAAGGAVGFPRLLPELHRHHLVVLHAPRRAAARHRAGRPIAVRPRARRSTSRMIGDHR